MKMQQFAPRLLFILLLALASSAPAQEEDPRITISLRDVEIGTLYEILNRQFGLNFIVANGITEEIPSGSVPDLGVLSDLRSIADAQAVRMIWLLPTGMDPSEQDRIKETCRAEGMVVREVSLRLGL